MKKIELPIPIDPGDPRYRQCLHCGYEFMTAHMARKFCSSHCHDHFHVNKRLKEQLQPQNEGLTSLLPDSNVTAIPETPNLAILHWLPVSDHGIEVELGFLLSVGFDLTRYDERFKLDKHGECHGLAFGEYQLYWTNPSKILIYKPSYTTVS